MINHNARERFGYGLFGLGAMVVFIASVRTEGLNERGEVLSGLRSAITCPPMMSEPWIAPSAATDSLAEDARSIMFSTASPTLPAVENAPYVWLDARYSAASSLDFPEEAATLIGDEPLLGEVVTVGHERESMHSITPSILFPGDYELTIVQKGIAADSYDETAVHKAESVCGTIAFTVGSEGELSDARLVDSPDAGNYRYIGMDS